jgi:hypothetical protein
MGGRVDVNQQPGRRAFMMMNDVLTGRTVTGAAGSPSAPDAAVNKGFWPGMPVCALSRPRPAAVPHLSRQMAAGYQVNAARAGANG